MSEMAVSWMPWRVKIALGDWLLLAKLAFEVLQSHSNEIYDQYELLTFPVE